MDIAERDSSGSAKGRTWLATLASAAVLTTAFTAGGAAGMLIESVNKTVLDYKKSVADYHGYTATAARYHRHTVTPMQSSEIIQTAYQAPARQAAWFPENNSATWSIAAAPGQPMGALSIRNGTTHHNLIAILQARSTDPSVPWIHVATVHVVSGQEALVRPPLGDYRMSFIDLPDTTPYSAANSMRPSPPVTFTLDRPEEGPIPHTRYEVSAGVIRRMPDIGQLTRTSATSPRRTDVRTASSDDQLVDPADDYHVST